DLFLARLQALGDIGQAIALCELDRFGKMAVRVVIAILRLVALCRAQLRTGRLRQLFEAGGFLGPGAVPPSGPPFLRFTGSAASRLRRHRWGLIPACRLSSASVRPTASPTCSSFCPSLQVLLELAERSQPPAFVLADPAVGNVVDGDGIQVVEFLAPALIR